MFVISLWPTQLKCMQLPKEEMFDQSGQWIHLETYEDFDNGLSDLIEFWSSETAPQAMKDSAFAHFKDDLEAAIEQSIDNRAKSRKFSSIAQELAEFEEVLNESSGVSVDSNSSVASAAPAESAKSRKKT